MWTSPAPFDDGHDVRGSKVSRVGKESACAAVSSVFHRTAEGIPLLSTAHFFARRSLASECRRRL